MPSRTPSLAGIGFAVLACLAMSVRGSDAQAGCALGTGCALRVENFFPHQVPRGRVTVINLIIATQDEIQSAEVTPAAGVTISGIKQGEPGNPRGRFPGWSMWSSMAIEVASDAAPGDRTLVLTMPTGRLPPLTVTIPTHVPAISELRVLPGPSRPSSVDLQFAVADGSADLGRSPYVWFTTNCGDDPLLGVVHGKLSPDGKSGGVVRATVPVRPAEAGGTTTVRRTCEVQLRVADALGFESNSLQTVANVAN